MKNKYLSHFTVDVNQDVLVYNSIRVAQFPLIRLVGV
jgi:hypothetical protein